MFKKLTQTAIAGTLLIGQFAVAAPVFAIDDTNDSEMLESMIDSIELELDEDDEQIVVWEYEGENQAGFKVVWSMDEDPEYPPRDGDKALFVGEDEDEEAVLKGFDGEGTYFVRVCEYLDSGEECGTYSNQVEVELDEKEHKGPKEFLNDKLRDFCEFEDVEDDHVICEQLRLAKRLGIANGANSLFEPETAITRGQFSAMLVRAFAIPSDTTGDGFSDVPSDHTFYDAIMTMDALEIFNGEDGMFMPDEEITRGQAVKVTINTMEALGLLDFPDEVTDEEFDLDGEFSDEDIEEHTFAPFLRRMLFITRNDINRPFNGYSDGRFAYDDSITRIQAVKVIVRMMNLGSVLSEDGELLEDRIELIKDNARAKIEELKQRIEELENLVGDDEDEDDEEDEMDDEDEVDDEDEDDDEDEEDEEDDDDDMI